MKIETFEIIPRDVLFLRDARPMTAEDVGNGANWPRPDQLNAALHHAYRQEEPHHYGGLKTFGLFPRKGAELFLPCPLDYGMKIVPCEGTNLPAPLTHVFIHPRQKGKVTLPQWIPLTAYVNYLKGAEGNDPPPTCPLYAADRNIGITIDVETGKAADKKIYQAEYLRLCEDVTMVFQAEYKDDAHADRFADALDRLVETHTFIFGGQQGIASLRKAKTALDIAGVQPKIDSRYLRVTLITPALFAHGWLPGWCKDTQGNAPLGTVMFRDYSFAKLIAARVGKPLAFSGWDHQKNLPRPTALAVPAGSSYVFDCGSVEDARQLAQRFTYPKNLSDLCGEQGFGLGICSSVQLVNL